MKETALILAGGGGHTGYGITIAEHMKDKIKLHFLVPDDDPLSFQLAQKYGEVEKIIKPRHPGTSYLKFIYRFIKALIQSALKLNNKYNVIISTGSNFCIPPAFMGWLKGIPIVNIESADKLLSPSKTARYLQPISKITVLQWEEQKKFLKGKVFGPLLPIPQIKISNKGHILIVSGTYGYQKLIDEAINIPEENVILQTGRINPEKYEKIRLNWNIFSNIPEFLDYLASADVVITPPGATALEALAYGKKIIIVNYPTWSKAGVKEEAALFAKKIHAPYIEKITTSSLVSALEKVKKIKIPIPENRLEQLIEEIIKISRLNKI